MRYVSIDIETTGLDPDKCQVLQIGAVVDDTTWGHVPVRDLPSFEMGFKHDLYQGCAFGLGMNGSLLMAIAEGVRRSATSSEVWDLFARWLDQHCGGSDRIVATGKNFASFDRQFLCRVWPKFNARFHHRSLDPAMAFSLTDDVVPPSTALCCRRAGLPEKVAHDALADARQVCELMRVAWRMK